MDDDFELEVIDLRTGQTLRTERETSAPPPPIPPPPDDEDVERSSLSGPSARGPSRRQMTGAVATVSLIVVVLIGLLGGIAGKLGGPFGPHVPTATLAPGADIFYLVNGVPWGKLQVDGRPLTLGYSQGTPVVFNLAIGPHTIVYAAPPFSRVTCTVSVPAATRDTCPMYTAPQDGNPNTAVPDGARGLDVGATVNHLSPDSLQALVSAAAQSIAAPISETTVPVGGRYQGANGSMLVAAEPLQAQVFYTLNTDPSASALGQNCVSLCDIPYGNGAPNTSSGWSVIASVVPVWRYTNASGATIQLPATPHVPGVATNQTGMPGLFLFFTVNWQGSWQVTPLFNNGPDQACLGATDVLYQDQAFSNWANGTGSTGIVAPNLADGCLMGRAILLVSQRGFSIALGSYSRPIPSLISSFLICQSPGGARLRWHASLLPSFSSPLTVAPK
jgi:hypothetical protein